MYLTPTEEDRLAIFLAAELARRCMADGARLNAPEATALVCDEMHRAARAGASLDGVLQAGRQAVRRDDLMDGIPALLPEIRLEVLIGDGTRLAVLREPWGPPAGTEPGEIRSRAMEVVLAPGLERRRITVTSHSARPIRVSSHYPFWRVNARLEFERSAAEGFRLDIPAGTSVRWAPGEVREVTLVALGGGTAPGRAEPA
ncbi:MAG TPA: urease subunit beta [Streptosporangiaceae bacterium]